MTIQPRSQVGVSQGYHSPQVDVRIRLNTNESPYPPPQELMERWAKGVAALSLNRYPDRHATKLCEDIAKFHNVPAEMVFVGNGSNEVLQSILLSYGGNGTTAMSFEPTYAMYETISRVTDTRYVPLERNASLLIEPGGLAERVNAIAPSVVFLCVPNNPTGMIETSEVANILLARRGSLVVIDEAYGQFCDQSVVDLVASNSNLVVVRTFSKIWSLAGMRIGYCIANKEIIETLWNVALPYHLDSSKALIGSLSFDYIAEMEARVASLVSERNRISFELEKLDVDTWPSATNFILFRPRIRDSGELWLKLVERGILIRDWSKWPRLENCLRVTVGTEQENDEFLLALREEL